MYEFIFRNFLAYICYPWELDLHPVAKILVAKIVLIFRSRFKTADFDQIAYVD